MYHVEDNFAKIMPMSDMDPLKLFRIRIQHKQKVPDPTGFRLHNTTAALS
jgi:hypothetical protein